MAGRKSKSLSVREYLKLDNPLSPEIFRKLINFKEEVAELDYKKSFDPNLKRDWLRLAKHIIAMANTRGGYIILGVSNDYIPVGMDRNILKSIDIANIYNKVNSYIEPDIDDIRFNVFRYKAKHFGSIFVPKSFYKTHVVKKTGNYQDERGRTTCELTKSHIYVRHGAKSEPINPSDLSRILNERIQQHKSFWMQGIRKISTAKIPAEVIVSPKEKEAMSVRVTTDPKAPAVRGILDREKCKTIHEELLCGLKAWKARPESFLTIPQLAEIYSVRKDLEIDEELAEFIMRSSFNSWMPAFYWATKVNRNKLEKILSSIVTKDEHPSTRECLKVILMLDKKFAKDALRKVLKKSHLNGAKSDAQKFLSLVEKKDRYKAIFNIGTFIRYNLRGKEGKRRIKDLLKEGVRNESLLDKISIELVKNPKMSMNKWALKVLDMIVYGFGYLQ